MKRLTLPVFVIAALATLALALPGLAHAGLTGVYVKIQNIDGSNCNSGCRVYYQDRSTPVYPTYSYATGSLRTMDSALIYSYPNGNKVTWLLPGPNYNAFSLRDEAKPWYIWAQKPCPPGFTGQQVTPIHSMPAVPSIYRNLVPNIEWWAGTFRLQNTCHIAAAAVALGAD